jgi:hypothetical protein
MKHTALRHAMDEVMEKLKPAGSRIIVRGGLNDGTTSGAGEADRTQSGSPGKSAGEPGRSPAPEAPAPGKRLSAPFVRPFTTPITTSPRGYTARCT